MNDGRKTMDWNKILNWRLLTGSHKFPGPDGGTCINEAAIVAAGFKYREITCAAECPACFSRVIAAYALQLNDGMKDDLRQELLIPYVVRLANTADVKEIEKKRAIYLAVQTVKRILPISLHAVGLKKEAQQCKLIDETVATANRDAADAATAAQVAAGKLGNAAAAAAANAAAHAAAATYAANRDAVNRSVAAATYAANAAIYSAYAAVYAATGSAASAHAATYAAYAVVTSHDDALVAAVADANALAAAAAKQIFTRAVTILDEAIRLGNQAGSVEIELVKTRMIEAKKTALQEIKS